MDLTPAQQKTRESFLIALLEAAVPLKSGSDPELTLELLVQAADLFKEHMERELQELRQEQAE